MSQSQVKGEEAGLGQAVSPGTSLCPFTCSGAGALLPPQVRGAGSPTALASSPQRLRTVPRCLPAPPARRPERGDAGGIRAISSATRGTDAVLSFPRSSRLPCPRPLLHSNLREEQLYRLPGREDILSAFNRLEARRGNAEPEPQKMLSQLRVSCAEAAVQEMGELGTRGASEPELLHPHWIFRFLSLYARLIAGQCLSLIVPFWIGCPPQVQSAVAEDWGMLYKGAARSHSHV
nr:uncharacterized protein LOC108407925 [Manis javanica]